MSDVVRQVQAVLGRAKPAQGVSARDFKQPRRMGLARRQALQLALENALPALERKLAEASGLRLQLALGSLGEVDAATIFAQASEIPCVLRFRCQKAPAWLVWDPAAAAGAVESLFGARSQAESPARRLSPTEAKIAGQFLSEIVRAIAAVLGLQVSDFALVQNATELGDWREAGADAEPYRCEVQLGVERGAHASTLHLYLSGVATEDKSASTATPDELPAHLERVEVELSARLAGCEISLDQLLALEEGDVIPLEARLGDPTTLSIEGLTLAQARIGSHRGRLAVRIERLSVQPETAA